MAISAPIVIGCRFLVRVLLDSISAPPEAREADRSRSVRTGPDHDVRGDGSEDGPTLLEAREQALERRDAAVRPVRRKIFLMLVRIGALGLLGVAVGFAVLGGPVLGGELVDDTGVVSTAGGAFIVGMLLLNTAGSGAVAAYSYVCGAAEHAQAQRGFRLEARRHHRLALLGGLGALRRYEARRVKFATLLLRAAARKRAGKLDGFRRIFRAPGSTPATGAIAATLVEQLAVANDDELVQAFTALVPPSLLDDDARRPTEEPA